MAPTPTLSLTPLILTDPVIYYQRLTYSSSHIIGLGLRGTNPHPIPNPVNTNPPCYLLTAPDVFLESHHRARAAWHQPHPIPNPVNTNPPYYLLTAPDVFVESYHRARAAWHQPPRHQVLAVLPRGRLSFLPMHRLLPLCQGTLVNHTPVHYVL